MFAVYKKIISPESSPILGPASPNLAPTNVNATNVNANNVNVNNVNANNAMESLSLCNCCCSPRNKLKNDDAPTAQQDPIQDPIQDPMQDPIKSKYEFGHATHYAYGVTTPRLLCDFE
jgi:hypothetical protein